MRIAVGCRTDIGRARERNEDAFLVREPLFVVADGMGGHPHGDVASRIAVQTLEEMRLEDADGAKELTDGIRRANRRILEEGASDRSLRGMGTTVTAILADVDDATKAHLAHVGDSRAYLLRDGTLQQLSEDHTLVQRMVREGKLTAEEASRHPQRNVLTRVLGVEEPLDVDMLTLDLHPGDRLLLCSDGLTSMVAERDLEAILERERDPQGAADALVEAANRGGGDDNITVIVLDVLDEDAPSAPATPAASSAEPQAAERSTETAPREEGDGQRRPRRRRGRVALWVVLVAVVVVGAILAFRAYVDRQWYVGEEDGRVAVFNGIPSTVAGFHLSHVAEVTDLSAPRVERLPAYGDLREGITSNINSRQDAEDLVNQMRLDLRGTGSGP